MEHILREKFRFVAVDLETANSDNISICRIGLAGVTNSGDIKSASSFVDPEENFDPSFESVHGITEEMVLGAPLIPDIIDTLRRFLESHALIQHSKFDERALRLACRSYGIPTLQTIWSDSLEIAQEVWPDLEEDGGHGLDNLTDKLGIALQHHHAEEHARASVEIVLMAEQKTGKPYRKILETVRRRRR